MPWRSSALSLSRSPPSPFTGRSGLTSWSRPLQNVAIPQSVSLSGCANSRQGSRGVRAGPTGIPPQGAGAGARARDATPFALRPAGGSSQDQEPPRPAAPHPLGISLSPKGRGISGLAIIDLFGDHGGGE